MFKENIKSLKFSYQEKRSNIKYEKYYFNGIYFAKKVHFKNEIENNLIKSEDDEEENMEESPLIFAMDLNKNKELLEKLKISSYLYSLLYWYTINITFALIVKFLLLCHIIAII